MHPKTEGYLHGTHPKEQARLARLNALTNLAFLEFLALRETDCVLEVGSGLGILANEAARRVPAGAVYGVEFASEQVAKARRDAPNVYFLRGDAQHLPFPDNRFDVVYCRYVLEHVFAPQQVVSEMVRTLKPGGRALAQENNNLQYAFDPDCPHFDALLPRYIALQQRLGGDGLMGKRLFGLFKRAGLQQVTLSYQPEIHTSDTPDFRLWLENTIHLLEGAAEGMQAHGLATGQEIQNAIDDLRRLLERDDASALFLWNRAVGIKPMP